MTESRPIPQEALDRLIDGELGVDEYRETLARLEQERGGWRRCALTFIETQAWHAEMASIRCQLDVEPAQAHPSRSARRRWKVFGVALAMAASFLAALAIGNWLGTGRRPFQPAARTVPLAGVTPDSFHQLPPRETSVPRDLPDVLPVAGTSERDAVQPGARASRPHCDAAAAGTSKRDAVPPVEQGHVWLAYQDQTDQQPKQLELPLVEWSPSRDWMLSPHSSPVPRDVQQILRRTGRQLRLQRQLVPMETRDGRCVVIPIEHVELSAYDGQLYQ